MKYHETREVFSKTLLVCLLFNKRGTRIYLNVDEMDLEAKMCACGIFREMIYGSRSLPEKRRVNEFHSPFGTRLY